jgi:hypothetical protein
MASIDKIRGAEDKDSQNPKSHGGAGSILKSKFTIQPHRSKLMTVNAVVKFV